jgi:hypothetical protein
MAQQAEAAAAAAGIMMCTHDAIQSGIHKACSGRLTIFQDENDTKRADRQNVRCLVNHLNSHSVVELCLYHVRFSEEGFNELLAYFARNRHMLPLPIGRCL